jgi:hypothetical protein
MKKLFSTILVLCFLLSGNAYANEKIYLCVGESGVDYLTAITPNKMIIWYGTNKEKDDRYFAEFDDRKIIFFKRTNLIAETWKKNGNQSFDRCRKVN